MADPASWLIEVPAHLREPLVRCAEGALPPTVALMQLLMAVVDQAEVERVCETLRDWAGARPPEDERASRLRELLRIADDNPAAFAVTKAVLAHAVHDRPVTTVENDLARWAEVFDGAVSISPEGSVALYSLGNPSLLRAATEEVAARLRDWGVLAPDRALLDLGCGIGRFAEVLAPELLVVVGVDISLEMLRLARRRCAGLRNVHFVRTSGRDLGPFADASFDIVLAADVFPYLVQSGGGLVERHVAEAARVLRPGGDCLILNFSYRADPVADRREIRELASRYGFSVRPAKPAFRLWDAPTLHLTKTG